MLAGFTAVGVPLGQPLSAQAVASMTAAVAVQVGAPPELVSLSRDVEYALAVMLSLSASSGVNGAAVHTALLAATASTDVTVQVNGITVVPVRRRRLSAAETTVTLLAYSTDWSRMPAFNASLYATAANGSLTTALVAAGVGTSGAALAAPPLSCAQFGVAVQCPPGTLDSAQVLRSMQPSALAASASLLDSLNSAGMGNITAFAVSQSPIVGASQRRAAAAIQTRSI